MFSSEILMTLVSLFWRALLFPVSAVRPSVKKTEPQRGGNGLKSSDVFPGLCAFVSACRCEQLHLDRWVQRDHGDQQGSGVTGSEGLGRRTHRQDRVRLQVYTSAHARVSARPPQTLAFTVSWVWVRGARYQRFQSYVFTSVKLVKEQEVTPKIKKEKKRFIHGLFVDINTVD